MSTVAGRDIIDMGSESAMLPGGTGEPLDVQRQMQSIQRLKSNAQNTRKSRLSVCFKGRRFKDIDNKYVQTRAIIRHLPALRAAASHPGTLHSELVTRRYEINPTSCTLFTM